MDVSKVKYSDLKTLDNGAKVVYINCNTDNNPILLQTPECDMPFDAGWFADSGENCGKFSLKASIGSDKVFSEKLGEFDQKLKEDIKKSKEWFKKAKLTTDAVDSMYNEMLKISKDLDTGEPDGKYPPQFTFKIVFRDGNCLCKFYDDSKTKIDIENLTGSIEEHQLKRMLIKGAKVKAIHMCNGVWISETSLLYLALNKLLLKFLKNLKNVLSEIQMKKKKLGMILLIVIVINFTT